jgi:hypothetical protein
MTEYHDHRDDCPFKFATLDVCDCVEKNMLDRIEALTKERDRHWDSFVHWRKEADSLTEQLAAAQHDAKEAEAYAEELEAKGLANRVAIMRLEANLATCEKYRDAYAECDRIGTQAVRDLEAKLAKVVDALEVIRDRQYYRMGPGVTAQVIARATLAEIKGESHE